MDVSTYYITTLTNAAMKLGPIIAFVVVGYFIFFKLPLLFFLRNMGITKKEFEQRPQDFQKDYSVENYKDFQRRMKLMGPPKETKKEEPKKEEAKKERPNQEQRQERRQERRQEAKKNPSAEPSPERIFSIATGERLTKEELKKRYHELLRQNHPDRVASMGEEFKKLAEKNTKEINKAYDKLKNKAA